MLVNSTHAYDSRIILVTLTYAYDLCIMHVTLTNAYDSRIMLVSKSPSLFSKVQKGLYMQLSYNLFTFGCRNHTVQYLQLQVDYSLPSSRSSSVPTSGTYSLGNGTCLTQVGLPYNVINSSLFF